MALPSAFLDELRARTPLRAADRTAGEAGTRRAAMEGRAARSTARRRPSFYVYDDHYHCFGCGAHGDAISFVMQSRRRRLHGGGRAAGRRGRAGGAEALPRRRRGRTPPPRPDRRAGDGAGRPTSAGCSCPRGAPRSTICCGRGLSRGDHPPLRPRLVGRGPRRTGRRAGDARGSSPDLLAEAGLLRAARTGRRAVGELFFNRVMFPIRDRRGRVISFGGRTLGDGQPKYLNGPETALFSKRRNLYALDLRARAAVRGGGGRVVVVEGYMDVIALHQAGFGGAVAPLGTALTEEQLEELWRLSPAPGAVLRRRCRRRPRRGPSGRTGAAAAGAGPHAALRRAAARRGPGHAGPAVRDRRRSRRCWTPRGRCRTRCSTCVREPGGQARRPSSVPAFKRRLEAAAERSRRPGPGGRVPPGAARPVLRRPRHRQRQRALAVARGGGRRARRRQAALRGRRRRTRRPADLAAARTNATAARAFRRGRDRRAAAHPARHPAAPSGALRPMSGRRWRASTCRRRSEPCARRWPTGRNRPNSLTPEGSWTT